MIDATSIPDRDAPTDAELASWRENPPEATGRWQPLALVGSGGQAVVWLAEDLEAGQRVALKFVRSRASSTARARWIRELRLGMQLQHPNLIRTLDVIEAGDELIAVLEWAGGGSLARRLAFEGRQAPEQVAIWCREALGVLAYLHDQRIVHRDVKPSNLLLDDQGSIRLADLGLVDELDLPSRTPLSSAGTRTHMPSEQRLGGEPKPWWDLHGLGVTLFQLVSGGLPPRDDDGTTELVAAPLRDQLERVQWLGDFIDRLLEHRPALRWTDACQALAALERTP
jgi:serine/threonine protein kinase